MTVLCPIHVFRPTDADPPSAKSMEDAIAAIDWHFKGLVFSTWALILTVFRRYLSPAPCAMIFLDSVFVAC